MLVDLTKIGITGKDAENALHAAGITVNKNMVPFDERSPFVTSGIRLGTPALTTRGFKENEMKQVAQLIDRVLKNIDNEDIYQHVKQEVKKLCLAFPLYDFGKVFD
jgi:glycine hydroxymethyltransferase